MADDAFIVSNPDGATPLLLTCEHASAYIPASYAGLGLPPGAISDHIGWDIGAARVTEELSRSLDAPAVLSAVSRLIVDCNRALTDHDLMPSITHGIAVPGNASISAVERQRRLGSYYDPYHDAIDRMLGMRSTGLLLSIHTFAPALNGRERAFDVGVLFDDFTAEAERLAGALAGLGFAVRMNEPYSGIDGLIFSARSHGRARGITYLELEVNNRLLRNEDAACAVACRVGRAVLPLLEKDGRGGGRSQRVTDRLE